MDKKHFYYGVSLDGLKLKIAELENNKGQVTLHRLESFKLTKPLFNEFADVSTASAPNESDLNINTFPDFDDDDIELPSDEIMQDFEDLSAQSSDFEGQKTSDPIDPVFQFLSQFKLNTARISISCIDGKAQWKKIRARKKANRAELQKLALTDYQLKDPHCHISFIKNADGSYHSITHQGDFELMTLLNNAASIAFNAKKPLHYQYVEPFEVSLLNIFNLIYPYETTSYTTLLYIGNESKGGIVIKNKEIVKTFTIVIMDKDPQKVREAVLAKLMLEQENSDFPIIENIILAGDFATNEDIEFYNKNTNFRHRLFDLDDYQLAKFHIDLRVVGTVNTKDIPDYIIPISLAFHSAFPKNKALLSFNLLPKKVAETYNYLALKWHGFLLLALICLLTFYSNKKYFETKSTLIDLRANLTRTEAELNNIKDYKDIIERYDAIIKNLRKANFDTASIASGKNSWNIIIEKLADFTNRTPMLWIDNLRTTDTRFTITGKAFRREGVTQLAMLFDNGHIVRIGETVIAGHNLWDFEIIFPRPLGDATTDIKMPNYLKSYEHYVEYVNRENRQQTTNNRLDRVVATTTEPIIIPHTPTPPPPPPPATAPTPPLPPLDPTPAPPPPPVPQTPPPPPRIVEVPTPVPAPTPVVQPPDPVPATKISLKIPGPLPIPHRPIPEPAPKIALKIPGPLPIPQRPIAVAVTTPTPAPAPAPTPTPAPTQTQVPAPRTQTAQRRTPSPPPQAPTPPSTPSSRLYEGAKKSYFNKDYHDAIVQLTASIRNYPNDSGIAQTYFLLGEIYYVIGSYESSIACFKEVYNLKKDRVPEALYFVSKAYEGMADYANAETHYRKLLSEFPSNSLARLAIEEIQKITGE